MNRQDIQLTLHETEQLCRLYMDCRLSVLEEAELEYLLGKLPYSTPIIDETRVLMGLRFPSATAVPAPPRKHGRILRGQLLFRVAASVAVICAIALAAVFHGTGGESGGAPVYIAYANGVRTDGEQTVRQVESDMQKAESFMHRMALIEAEEQQKVEDFMNHQSPRQ